MNMNANELEKDVFSIEDVIVPYSNIEITHANDNKAPIKVTVIRIVVVLIIVALISALVLV